MSFTLRRFYHEAVPMSRPPAISILTGLPYPMRITPQEKIARGGKKGRKLTFAKALPLTQGLDVLKAYSALQDKEKVFTDLILHYNSERASANSIRGFIEMVNPFPVDNRILAFVPNDQVDSVIKAGAVYAGGKDLIPAIQEGKLDFNQCICATEMISVARQLAKVLGPRKLMPSLKTGTLCDNVEEKVSQMLRSIPFQGDKSCIVRIPLGPLSFPSKSILENFQVSLETAKSSCSLIGKGGNILNSVSLSFKDGPTILIDDVKLR